MVSELNFSRNFSLKAFMEGSFQSCPSAEFEKLVLARLESGTVRKAKVSAGSNFSAGGTVAAPDQAANNTQSGRNLVMVSTPETFDAAARVSIPPGAVLNEIPHGLVNINAV